jgi:hypothetical protein
MKKTMFTGLSIITTIAVVMVGSAVIPVAYAVHNGEGHSDKFSLGECYRFTGGDKDFCQDNKEDWKEGREANQGPPNGDQDGEPADPHPFD